MADARALRQRPRRIWPTHRHADDLSQLGLHGRAQGATTIWELWNGDTADPAMNSGNHVMLVGDLGIWLYEYLAGIRPDPAHPGFRRFLLAPCPVGDLESVSATFDSVRGPITSRWQISGPAFAWEFSLPANTPRHGICADGRPVKREGG